MHLGAVYNMHRHAADLRETEREMSPEKRTLVTLIIPQRVELLKGSQFGGIQQHPRRKEKLVPTQTGGEGMSDSIGKPWPVAALSIGWAGGGQFQPPPPHCYIFGVSRKDTLRVRKGLWHPSTIQC